MHVMGKYLMVQYISPLLLIVNETSFLTYWISAQYQCCPGRDGRNLESFREIWMNVVLAKIVA